MLGRGRVAVGTWGSEMSCPPGPLPAPRGSLCRERRRESQLLPCPSMALCRGAKKSSKPDQASTKHRRRHSEPPASDISATQALTFDPPIIHFPRFVSSWSPKVPSTSHLGVFVSGAGVGPAGAGPEGVSSGVWAGVRSSMSSDSMGSRGGASLSTGSDGCELKAVSEATVGVCGGG